MEKGLIALRKSAASKGIAHGKVVTKEDFDKHVKAALVPQSKKEPTTNKNTTRSRSVNRGENLQKRRTDKAVFIASLGDLFRSNLDEAVQNVLDSDRARREKSSRHFSDWLATKRTDEEQLQQKKVTFCFFFEKKKKKK